MRRSITGLIAGSFLAGLLAVAAPVAVAPGAEAATACPRIQIFGVRGSGESADDYSGYGRTVYTVIQAVKAQLGDAAVGRWATSYRAIPVDFMRINYVPDYNSSVEGGKVALKSMIDTFLAGRCGATSKLVIVGYSQGAHVAADVFQARLTATQRSRVIALALIADPRFKGSGASVPNVGDYSTRLNGIYDLYGSPRVFASDQYTKVRSYCALTDPICNFSATNGAACKLSVYCVHTNYFSHTFAGRTYTDWAAAFIVKQANALAPAPTAMTTWSRVDAAGDVVSRSSFVDPPIIAAPERTAGDITSVSVEASQSRVRFVFKFRDLPAWDPFSSGFGVSLVQGEKSVGVAFLDATEAILSNGYSNYVCKGQAPGFSVSSVSKQIVVSIPDRCLEGMRYFKFFSYAYANTNDNRMFIDDANRTGFPTSGNATYSPVIYRW